MTRETCFVCWPLDYIFWLVVDTVVVVAQVNCLSLSAGLVEDMRMDHEFVYVCIACNNLHFFRILLRIRYKSDIMYICT